MREIPPTAGLPLRWADLRPAGRPLEQGLADFLHVPTAQITCSGTAAQIIALKSLMQRSRRRKVILPGFSCPLVALAVLHCGLEPVLCDLQPDHFDLDHRLLEQLCDADTLAIVATHLGGRVADMSPVLAVAHKHGAYVIEDAAQSLGATWQGRPVGLAGDAGFYSLAVGKGLTTYEGGVLISRDPALQQQMQDTARDVAPFKWGWEMMRSLELLGYAALYQPLGLPLAYGVPLRRALKQGKLIEAVGDDFSDDIPLHSMGHWRKSVGANALARLPGFIQATRQQAEQRLTQLAGIPAIQVMRDARDGQGTWPFFMILMPDRASRDAALAQVWERGLGASRLYIHAMPDYPYLRGRLGYVDTPVARDFASRMLTISNSLWMDDGSFADVLAAIRGSVG